MAAFHRWGQHAALVPARHHQKNSHYSKAFPEQAPLSREGGARERHQEVPRCVEGAGDSLRFLVVPVLLPPGLPPAVNLVSCDCPGFKLVTVQLLTLGANLSYSVF